MHGGQSASNADRTPAAAYVLVASPAVAQAVLFRAYSAKIERKESGTEIVAFTTPGYTTNSLIDTHDDSHIVRAAVSIPIRLYVESLRSHPPVRLLAFAVCVFTSQLSVREVYTRLATNDST
jgi:hypothetical protein